MHCYYISLININFYTEITCSIVSFSNIIKLDPYRIDNFDLLSNLMYVCDNREEIVALSKHVASIDRYRQETLCVLGMILILVLLNFIDSSFYHFLIHIDVFILTFSQSLLINFVKFKNGIFYFVLHYIKNMFYVLYLLKS